MPPDYLFLGEMYFLDGEIFAGENGLVKASAVRAIALGFDYVEDLVAVVALGKAGDGLHYELCILQQGVLHHKRIYILNILGDDEGQFADLYHDLTDALNIVLGGKIQYGFAHLPYNAYLMHG